jgi:5-methylcytosine-specific restriction endonuclease McrA
LAWFSSHFCGENSPHWRGGSVGYYGPNWDKQRKAANQRDNFTCQFCGKKKTTRYLDAAHVVPFRHFGLQRYKKANRLSNLVTLCRSCHTKYDWANGTRT